MGVEGRLAIHKINVPSSAKTELVNITSTVNDVLDHLGATDGICQVYTPHTTAGIVVNENADPDVGHDILAQLDQMVPWQQSFYRHAEGNSASHVKASMMGSSVIVLVEAGRLVLGRWQGVYLCEFDGPRTRQVMVRLRPPG